MTYVAIALYLLGGVYAFAAECVDDNYEPRFAVLFAVVWPVCGAVMLFCMLSDAVDALRRKP